MKIRSAKPNLGAALGDEILLLDKELSYTRVTGRVPPLRDPIFDFLPKQRPSMPLYVMRDRARKRGYPTAGITPETASSTGPTNVSIRSRGLCGIGLRGTLRADAADAGSAGAAWGESVAGTTMTQVPTEVYGYQKKYNEYVQINEFFRIPVGIDRYRLIIPLQDAGDPNNQAVIKWAYSRIINEGSRDATNWINKYQRGSVRASPSGKVFCRALDTYGNVNCSTKPQFYTVPKTLAEPCIYVGNADVKKDCTPMYFPTPYEAQSNRMTDVTHFNRQYHWFLRIPEDRVVWRNQLNGIFPIAKFTNPSLNGKLMGIFILVRKASLEIHFHSNFYSIPLVQGGVIQRIFNLFTEVLSSLVSYTGKLIKVVADTVGNLAETIFDKIKSAACSLATDKVAELEKTITSGGDPTKTSVGQELIKKGIVSTAELAALANPYTAIGAPIVKKILTDLCSNVTMTGLDKLKLLAVGKCEQAQVKVAELERNLKANVSLSNFEVGKELLQVLPEANIANLKKISTQIPAEELNKTIETILNKFCASKISPVIIAVAVGIPLLAYFLL